VNLSRTTDRRRVVALAVLACLSIGSAVGLAGGLVSCTPADEQAEARPLSAAEAQRLASMRLVNYRDKRAGVEAHYGKGDATVRMTGWVDWTRALVYLNVGGPGAGAYRGLIQATPGILATRPATPADDADAAPVDRAVDAPPVTPPADGWHIRAFSVAGPTPAPLESFLALLFTVATDRPDAADVLERSESRWVGSDKLAGTQVDVLLGPAVPPREAVPPPAASPSAAAASPAVTASPSFAASPRVGAKSPGATPKAGAPPSASASPAPEPSALAQMGGGVRYWIDAASRMHRFEALLGADLPVEVDFNRTDNPEFVAVDAFGGRPVKARAVTAEEADVLSRVAQRNLNRGGGALDLTVPTVPAANLRGAGWIDWKEGVAYLSVRDTDKPADVALMRANREGVAVLPTKPRANARPPLPAPTSDRWKYQRWIDRADTSGGLDLDLLVAEALTLAAGQRDDLAALRQRASWLRTDTIDERPVTVYEIAKPQETGAVRRGQARMRYWIDKSGGLRRIELRTRTGAFAQLDITPGEVPDLPSVPR
jgi:hypothetical protein